MLTTAPPEAGAAIVRQPDRRAGRGWDVGIVVAANAVVVVGLWFRHGGLAAAHGTGGALTAVGQVTGLLGTAAVLLSLLLMARIPDLERVLGFDQLARWHRWTGFVSLWLVVTHAVTITLGYAAADQASIAGELGDFVRHYPDVLMAIVGTALLVAVAVTSARAARRRLARETWHFVHLYAYLAVALTFAHQLAVGSDLADDPLARAWWAAMYVAVIGAIAWWRVGWPIVFNHRHRLVVSKVVDEGPGVVSLYVTGRHLDRIGAESGQFFLWRFRTRRLWWEAHPFSLSAPPNVKWLRVTIKDLGDFSGAARLLRPGTRIFAEGPYGAFTAKRRTRRKVALIAGGIGITPLRALVESMRGRPGDITLVYRVARKSDLVFRDELRDLVAARGITMHTLVGTDVGDDRTDRLGVPALRQLVPDIARRDVFLCGPPAMVDAVHRRLRTLGVPRAHIHDERFGY